MVLSNSRIKLGPEKFFSSNVLGRIFNSTKDIYREDCNGMGVGANCTLTDSRGVCQKTWNMRS